MGHSSVRQQVGAFFSCGPSVALCQGESLGSSGSRACCGAEQSFHLSPSLLSSTLGSFSVYSDMHALQSPFFCQLAFHIIES